MASLRDRFFTPRVAHAIVSPGAIMATGAGAALGILVASGPLMPVAAIGLGAAALAARVALAIPRGGPRAERIDPFTLDEPWRRLTQDVLAAQIQFNEAARQTPEGPIRDRLERITQTIDANVEDAWRTARAGNELARAYDRLKARQAADELDEIRATGSQSDATQATEAALIAQLETAQRMYDTITTTRERLRLLNEQLDEAATRCIELSVGVFRPDQFAQLEGRLGSITNELEALREAIDDTDLQDAQGTGTAVTQPDIMQPDVMQPDVTPPGTGRPGGATG